MRIDELQSALVAVGAVPTARELAEILWLAQFLPASTSIGELGLSRPRSRRQRSPADASEASSDSGDRYDARPTDTIDESTGRDNRRSAFALHAYLGSVEGGFAARSLLVPSARVLGERLDLQRALRPLKRTVPSRYGFTIDEESTADGIAERLIGHRVWLPIIRPARERWLDLTLVIDIGSSMTIWAQLADELRDTLIESGIFRNVTTWYLASDDPDRVTLASHKSGNKQAQPPEAVLRSEGRHVIVVLSDCSGFAWHGGAASRALRKWGHRSPLAIFQPLPERLWWRTAAPTTVGRAVAATQAAPNSELDFAPLDGLTGIAAGAVAVPVLEIDPDWVARWAAQVAAGGTLDPIAVAYLTGERADSPVKKQLLSPIPRDRVLAFQAAASPQAFRLATCLAATTPALPVMHLVQRALFGRSVPTHLAEVVLSGLLYVVDGPAGRYEFVDGVREELLNAVSRSDAAATLNIIARISASVEHDAGLAARTFRALVPGDADGSHRIAADSLPFALIDHQALDRLLPRQTEGVLDESIAAPAAGDQETNVPELRPRHLS